MIVFNNVSKSFDDHHVLDNISFRVEPGEFVCLTGPSGAGKSTIVHLLIRAELPTDGTIEVDGQNIRKLPPSILQLFRRRTGVVFQDYKLLSDRTVYENVAFAMEVCGDSNDVIDKRVPELLKQVGLTTREHAYPRELSGGEKARAALARALVHDPMIVVADEPTGNIDPEQSFEILELLKAVNKTGVTIVLATHDDELVDALQTRVLRIEKGTVVRDDIGGYRTKVADKSIVEDRKHQIFDTATTVAEEVPVKKEPPKNGGDTGSRKIKPIAI